MFKKKVNLVIYILRKEKKWDLGVIEIKVDTMKKGRMKFFCFYIKIKINKLLFYG